MDVLDIAVNEGRPYYDRYGQFVYHADCDVRDRLSNTQAECDGSRHSQFGVGGASDFQYVAMAITVQPTGDQVPGSNEIWTLPVSNTRIVRRVREAFDPIDTESLQFLLLKNEFSPVPGNVSISWYGSPGVFVMVLWSYYIPVF